MRANNSLIDDETNSVMPDGPTVAPIGSEEGVISPPLGVLPDQQGGKVFHPEDDHSEPEHDDHDTETGLELADGVGPLSEPDIDVSELLDSSLDLEGSDLASAIRQEMGGSQQDFTGLTSELDFGAFGKLIEAWGADGPTASTIFDADDSETDAVDLAAVSAPGPKATLNELADYLNNQGGDGADFWEEAGSGGISPYINVTNSGANAKGGVVTYNLSGNSYDSNGVSSDRADMIRHALNIYEDVLGINFVESTSFVADIDFTDNDTGAYAQHFGVAGDGAMGWARVNIASNWNGSESDIGGYSFQTALHEIGHVLGLGHQGLYNAGNGNPTYQDSYWENDSWQQTIMSYWSQTSNTDISASYAELIGPMAVDWLALENIYGSQGYGVSNGATTGNTTWGFNSTWSDWNPGSSGPAENSANSAYAAMDELLATNAVCIVDGGGLDTLDLSGFANNTVIDVSEAYGSSKSGSISSVAGLVGNLTIAVGTIIENVVGGAGSEKIFGNGAANLIRGNAGNDEIHGYGGDDTILGGGNNDKIYGDNGEDVLAGGNGHDTIFGGDQNDTLYGENGNDRIWGGNGRDTAFLGDGNDEFNDNSQNNNNGNDEVHGGAGNDKIFGGGGKDEFHGDNGEDLIKGGIGNDLIYGGDQEDELHGENGNDRVWGGNGRDLAYLGGGNDEFNDNSQNNSNGDDEVHAGSGNDSIFGGGGKDKFYGDDGEDLIRGGMGNDLVYGGNQNDLLFGEDGHDKIWGGNGKDVVYLGNGNDVFYDSDQNTGAGDDKIYAGNGNDVINVGGGNNILKGGGGADTFKFNASKATGLNEILDFEGGTDILQMSGVDYSDLVISATGDGVLVEWSKGEVKLVDYGIGEISVDDFLFV